MFELLQNLTVLSFVAAFVIAGLVLPLLAGSVFCGVFRPKCRFFDGALDVLVGKLFPALVALEVILALLMIFAEFLAAR